jgi:hypothetical protein
MEKGNNIHYGSLLQYTSRGKYQGPTMRVNYGCQFGGNELPRRSLRESPFSDFGLFLMGLVLTSDQIKKVEREVR